MILKHSCLNDFKVYSSSDFSGDVTTPFINDERQIKTPSTIAAKIITCILFAIVLCLFCVNASGQEFTAKDSAAFQKALTGNVSDFDRINYQLELAEYSIRKPGSFKADLDNARAWIDKSKKINAGLKSKEAAGHILFEECYLQQEYGASPKGKAMLEAVIALLKNGNDKCLLGNAYRELANYYDFNNAIELPHKIEFTKISISYYRECGNKDKTAATLQYLADLALSAGNYALTQKCLNESFVDLYLNSS